jgi:hypothetical protein
VPLPSLDKYAAFLSFLLTIGPKLQALWPLVQAWITATTALVTGVKGLLPSPTPGVIPAPTEGGTLSLYDPTAEEIELEGKVVTLIIPSGPNDDTAAIFDAATLRTLWQLAQMFPQVVDLLRSLKG